MVVGPASEEIYTDKFGRIKVHFFWDRLGKKDENSSCWIRVAQVWSGKKWGAQFLPRVGQEVLISFMEGDPDRPIVVGSVYNADQMPTYDLPANKAISGIKSRSTKGAGTENYNELRFEDEKGKELLYIHSEKNEQEVIENDQSVSVGNDSVESIGNDATQSVGNDKTLSVEANHTESIGKVMAVSVGEDRSLDVGKNQTITVGEDQTESVGKGYTLDIAKDLMETVGGQHSEAVTKEYSLSAKKIQLTADDEITLKVGSAKISMKKNGDIVISGGKLNIKGSGAVGIKGSKITQN
jgi:type VI secretion system secreted protein VgrG